MSEYLLLCRTPSGSKAFSALAMPSMSKLSVAVGTGLAATAFVAPVAPSTSTSSASSLRGRGAGASSLGLGAGLSISGLAAMATMALSRPVAKAQTQVVLNAYDASKDSTLVESPKNDAI